MKNKKIQVYESVACCSGGGCGININARLHERDEIKRHGYGHDTCYNENDDGASPVWIPGLVKERRANMSPTEEDKSKSKQLIPQNEEKA
jgi:hypothetical protein